MAVKVDTMPGVAFYSPSECEDEDHSPDCRQIVMVGDDRVNHIDVSDIAELDDDAYCSGCGQIGCRHG